MPPAQSDLASCLISQVHKWKVRDKASSPQVTCCACCPGVYKPTQDREGLQRKTLERTGNAIFQWCLGAPGHPDTSPSEHSDTLVSEAEQEAAGSHQALSAARVLEGLMDMEHRAVQPALDQLWAVIWKCALLEEGSYASSDFLIRSRVHACVPSKDA